MPGLAESQLDPLERRAIAILEECNRSARTLPTTSWTNAPHASQALILREARLTVALGVQWEKNQGFVLNLTGTSLNLSVLTLRANFRATVRLEAEPPPASLGEELLLPNWLRSGLSDADYARLANGTRDDAVVFPLPDGGSIGVKSTGKEEPACLLTLPDGTQAKKPIDPKEAPLQAVIALLETLGAQRPSTRSVRPAGPTFNAAPPTANGGAALLRDMSARVGRIHLKAGERFATKTEPWLSRVFALGAYGLSPTSAVCEVALTKSSALPDTNNNDVDLMTFAVAVTAGTGTDGSRLRQSLGPPDILCSGGVFDAFARAIAGKHKVELAGELGVSPDRLASAQLRLVARYQRNEAKGFLNWTADLWDRDLVVMDDQASVLVFRVCARATNVATHPRVEIDRGRSALIYAGPLLASTPADIPPEVFRNLWRMGSVAKAWTGGLV